MTPFFKRVQLSKCLEEVTRGVGATWSRYRVVGATRGGLAAAKEGVGKNPERYKLVEPGTIFYNPMRILLGSIALLDEGQPPGITSPDYVVFRTRSGVVHPRWFYYWLRSEEGEAFIRTLARGAVRERMLFRRLAEAEIEVAAYDSQRKFAWTIRFVERARAAAESQLEAAKALPAVCLKEMFESAEALVWPQRRLGDLMRLRKEIVHPRERPRGRVLFVGLEHIESGTGARVDSASIEMAELTGRKPRFYEGDIVYGYLRPYLNKVWVAEFDGLCSVDQYVYAVDPRVADTRFISAFMKSHVYLARAPVHATPGQLPRIRTEEVASVMINLPPVVDQQRMVGQLEVRMTEAERVRRMAEAQVAAINALPTALLRRAFSGEL